ncbi:G-type lectin S-receptor-like serine/threonine-protein kinase SD2-5 [Coffea eugenioides]|uniref:G-type lectin S-receptor-like serine/threonine-protein kinase SD2-5 n=1 Tax=Coffea eugenioides TaxID=49369 RepID=UPI000F609EE7|nr:G-type lectin S-receptor-like serine/threonine-protein kinase SD2-5 [Coffea eugenioides]
MARWSFKEALRLVFLVIVVLQINFLSTEVVAQETAKISTSWRNNNHSVANVTRALLYPYYTFNDSSGPFMQIILLKEIRPRVGYACGFVSNGTDDSFVFSIGIVHYRTDFVGVHYWSDLDVVWFANRNKPIRENGTLQFLPDGNLILKDADGTLVWSTSTSNKGVVGMKVMETGNLVLHDGNNQTVWQSFDHPTDTLLPGQKLVDGQTLVARLSETSWNEGNYYLLVNHQGLFAFYKSNSPQMYFNFFIRGERESIETSYVKAVNGTLALYISSAEPNEPDAVFSKPSSMKYIRYDYDGHFRVYNEENGPVDLLADFLSECDYPTVCGSLALCSGGQCSCPSGFERSDNQNNSGCVEINPTKCDGPRSHGLLHLTDVYYFNYVDFDAAVLKATDIESCRWLCLRNCSCKAVLFQHFFSNFSRGNCFLPSPVLSLISDGKQRNDFESSAFIKISNDMSNTSGSSASSKRKGIIAGLTAGIFCLSVVILGICIVRRKKQSTEEDVETYWEQLSGMPVRFSFQELQDATGNFSKLLGEGGFGSVFEGVLKNEEKIAVKQLNSLGQGKKEFLAEVQTIGSIHHINLVRLIGFCVENHHRLLVYEFMNNGSLDKWIFSKDSVQPTLVWLTRRNIIHDIAKGLAYLHEECRQKIVHLDIKPQNILLDENLCAKVSDFGLSKSIDKDQNQIVTTLRGTPGYLAPEWLSSFITEKADVYSFGVVVMEIICLRKNFDMSESEDRVHLLDLFRRKDEEDRLIDMIESNDEDTRLNISDMIRTMKLALWCLRSDFTQRPSMSAVVKVMEGTLDPEINLEHQTLDFNPLAAIRRKSEFETTVSVPPSVLSGPR